MTMDRVHRDPTGFPMLWVESLGAYVHWAPVTKIQFEHFICDAGDRAFDLRWYETVMALNPRLAPGKLTIANYWQAFASGILPVEAQRFAFWCGKGYRLPSAEHWRLAYRELASLPLEDLDAPDLWTGGDGAASPPLSPRARQLLQRLEEAAASAATTMGYSRRLADQMLLRLGVLEWVTDQDRWGGMGEPFPAFCGNLAAPERDAPILPWNAESERLACFGFRLLYDGAPR